MDGYEAIPNPGFLVKIAQQHAAAGRLDHAQAVASLANKLRDELSPESRQALDVLLNELPRRVQAREEADQARSSQASCPPAIVHVSNPLCSPVPKQVQVSPAKGRSHGFLILYVGPGYKKLSAMEGRQHTLDQVRTEARFPEQSGYLSLGLQVEYVGRSDDGSGVRLQLGLQGSISTEMKLEPRYDGGIYSNLGVGVWLPLPSWTRTTIGPVFGMRTGVLIFPVDVTPAMPGAGGLLGPFTTFESEWLLGPYFSFDAHIGAGKAPPFYIGLHGGFDAIFKSAYYSGVNGGSGFQWSVGLKLGTVFGVPRTAP